MPWILVLLLLVMPACSHTEPFAPVLPEKLGPLQPPGERSTQPLQGRTGARWTPDGEHILYTYNSPNTSVTPGWPTLHCFGIIPRQGGTQIWQSCDTRGSHLDSVDVMGIPALSPDGRILFLQAVYRRPLPGATLTIPEHTAFWVADTAAPLARRIRLFESPSLIGDSAISWIDQPGWIDRNTFLALAQRFIAGKPGGMAPQPRFMTKGVIHQDSATLTPIIGTTEAMAWSLAPNGDILYLPGHYWLVRTPGGASYFQLNDSTIWRVPVTGGSPSLVAIAPRRLEGISCAGTDCLMSDYELNCGPASSSCSPEGHDVMICTNSCQPATSRVYHLDLNNGAIRLLVLAPRSKVQLSPDGTRWLYFQGGAIWQIPFQRP